MAFNNELTFDQIGNMSEEEITDNQENISDGEDSPFASDEEDIKDDINLDEEDIEDTDQEEVADGSQEDEENSDEGGNSPNFVASIATAIKKEGILSLLDDSDFEEIKDAADLAILFNKQVDRMFDEKQQRISKALEINMEPDAIREYEQALGVVNGIDTSILESESADGEKLRGQVLIQDYLNKGFSIERARREASKSIEAGTDIEDSKEALEEMKVFYTKNYDDAIKNAEKVHNERVKQEKEFSSALEKRFLETEEPIKGIKLNKSERQKLHNQYAKFVDKDDKGNPLTAIQKYAKENPADYQYNINALFYLTDGFKDLGKVVNKEVKKKTKSAFNDLEKKLSNSNNRVGGGGLNFVNDKSSDSYSGWSVQMEE